MARSSGSTVVRRRLGTALRNLREEANIRIEAAARELECSAAKVSRLENGLGPAKKLEVRALLDLYGVNDAGRRAEFDSWADDTKSAGWWESDADVLSDDETRFLAYETEARWIRLYSTPSLPVLLMTSAAAAAHFREWHPGFTAAEVRRAVDVQQERHRELLDPHGSLGLTAIVDEGAVYRHHGDPETQQAQLSWLADTLDAVRSEGREDIELRVLPFSAGPIGRAISPFAIFTPRLAEDPGTAFVEGVVDGVWLEAVSDVAALARLFDTLQDRSLDPDASRTLIRDAADAAVVPPTDPRGRP